MVWLIAELEPGYTREGHLETVAFSEWLIRPGQTIQVEGVAHEIVDAEGPGRGYRTIPRRWAISPAQSKPLLVLAGEEEGILAGFSAHPLELPDRYLSREPARVISDGTDAFFN